MKMIKVTALINGEKQDIFLNPSFIASIEPIADTTDDRIVEIILCRGRGPEALPVVKESIQWDVIL